VLLCEAERMTTYTKRQVTRCIAEVAIYGSDTRGWGYVVFPLNVLDNDEEMASATKMTDSTPKVGRSPQQCIEEAYVALETVYEGDYEHDNVVLSHDGQVFLGPFPKLAWATAAWQFDPRKTRVAAQPSFPPLNHT
jgi:hypothetical protein